MLLAKKLRLAAAGLTDIGRRRERNQDNVTHYVPADENELAEKGALFVVCDGMGGHAAGEIASELGVNAIRDVYYSSDEEDVIGNIANAIKSANEAIFSYARQHPESAGMGTTCVSVLIHGGRAYFVNFGDSRAYIVRDGSMRQVTLDHSWVAEQVRAGLLTEEQARTHAHRNVITRSLGTGPTVTADLFVETLKQGDRLLLCSDGLHGYVDEREIEREMLQHTDPEDGVQTLVDMANNNGGPDNITALVIHLIEVPSVSDELKLPVVGAQDEQTITQPIPVVSAGAGKAGELAAATAGGSSHALPPTKIATAKQRRSNPLVTAAVRLLAVAAVLVILAGGWDFTLGPYAQMRNATQQLQSAISHAQQVVSQSGQQDPTTALSNLSQARQQVVQSLQNTQADPQVRQSAQQVLDTQVTPAVQSAIQRYDTAALIKPLAASETQLSSVSCVSAPGQAATPLSSVSALAAVAPTGQKATTPPAGSQTLYAISSNALYQLVAPLDPISGKADAGTVTCNIELLPTGTTPVALASDGETLFVLAQQSATAYEVLIFAPNGTAPNGQPLLKSVGHFGLPAQNGEVPALIAAQGATTYVSYALTGGSPGIWVFNGNNPKGPAKTIPLTQAASSLAATNGTLYILLSNGTLGQLDATQTFQPLQVQIQAPLSPTSSDSYSAATPVPTVAGATSGGANAGSVFQNGAVVAADANAPTTVYVGDGASNRVVRFSASAAGPGVGLSNQFVYSAPLTHMQQLALAANATVLNVYGWSGSQLASFSVDEPAATPAS